MEYTVPLFPEGGRGEKEERKKSLRRGVLGEKGGRKRKEKRAGGISCSQKKRGRSKTAATQTEEKDDFRSFAGLIL